MLFSTYHPYFHPLYIFRTQIYSSSSDINGRVHTIITPYQRYDLIQSNVVFKCANNIHMNKRGVEFFKVGPIEFESQEINWGEITL